MAEAKTKASGKSVETFLAGIEDEERRKDARVFLDLMARVTGEPPKMWGDSIVGFGPIPLQVRVRPRRRYVPDRLCAAQE